MKLLTTEQPDELGASFTIFVSAEDLMTLQEECDDLVGDDMLLNVLLASIVRDYCKQIRVKKQTLARPQELAVDTPNPASSQ